MNEEPITTAHIAAWEERLTSTEKAAIAALCDRFMVDFGYDGLGRCATVYAFPFARRVIEDRADVILDVASRGLSLKRPDRPVAVDELWFVSSSAIPWPSLRCVAMVRRLAVVVARSVLGRRTVDARTGDDVFAVHGNLAQRLRTAVRWSISSFCSVRARDRRVDGWDARRAGAGAR